MFSHSSFRVLKLHAFAAAAACLLAASASAAPIVSALGTATSGGNSNVTLTQANLVSWTQTDHYNNVAISAALMTFGTTAETGTAYLMNQVGAGTTVANQIASTAFTFALSAVSYVNLFSGLDLTAGTYYLVLAGNGTNSVIITGATGYTTAAGTSVGAMQFAAAPPAYVPAATFVNSGLGNRFFEVTGDLVNNVPEPSTLLLGGLALALVAVGRVRRQ